MRVTLTCFYNNTLLPATSALAHDWQPDAHSMDRMLTGYRMGDTLWRSLYPLTVDIEPEHPQALTGLSPTAWHEQLCDRLFRHLNADERPNGRFERSMSVGDLCRVSYDGQRWFYACENVGWVSVPDPDEEDVINATLGGGEA